MYVTFLPLRVCRWSYRIGTAFYENGRRCSAGRLAVPPIDIDVILMMPEMDGYGKTAMLFVVDKFSFATDNRAGLPAAERRSGKV